MNTLFILSLPNVAGVYRFRFAFMPPQRRQARAVRCIRVPAPVRVGCCWCCVLVPPRTGRTLALFAMCPSARPTSDPRSSRNPGRILGSSTWRILCTRHHPSSSIIAERCLLSLSTTHHRLKPESIVPSHMPQRQLATGMGLSACDRTFEGRRFEPRYCERCALSASTRSLK